MNNINDLVDRLVIDLELSKKELYRNKRVLLGGGLLYVGSTAGIAFLSHYCFDRTFNDKADATFFTLIFTAFYYVSVRECFAEWSERMLKYRKRLRKEISGYNIELLNHSRLLSLEEIDDAKVEHD